MTARPIALAMFLLAAPATRAQQPVHPSPRFTAGQTLRYAMDFRAEREGATSGAIENPQAPRKAEVSVSALMRIDVLRAEPNPAGSGERYRLRGTYEKLASTTRLDVPDPGADNETQLRRLEGRSVEFTVDAEGKVTDVTGLEDLFPEQAGNAAQWLGQFGLGAGVPRAGITPGQKWSAGEKLVEGTPLAGMVWRGESTYLGNEPCHPSVLTAEGKVQPGAARDTCAVIMTRFEVAPRAGSRDATPEEFRRRNLRSTGKMTGSGESLAYVSLATGWLVSVTQTSTEETDITVTSLETGAEVRYTGRVRSQSSVSLVSDAPIQ